MRVMRDLVGETLSGRYRLAVRLAGGGMGEVYRGHDLLLDRAVAVKVLQPALAADPEVVARFKDEARAAARLSHPNVVAVYDWGAEDPETYFMVMEYVAGTDLRDLLVARGSLEPAQAVDVVSSVCDALAAAHSCGLVHRDVKPENVLIAGDGKVKVADFGIAVVADADRTMPGGGVPGTLRYLSPEQAQGLPASYASDVWSAGAVLSELLTGMPPQQGSGTELLKRRASEPPTAPSRLEPSVPAHLDEIVLKACALDPWERFVDASDMAAELRRARVRSLPDAPPITTLLDEVTGEIQQIEGDPSTYVRPGRNRRMRSGAGPARALVVALVVAMVAFAGAQAVAAWLAPDPVPVADVVGMTRDGAERELRSVGLGLEVVGRERKLGTMKGEVVSQRPRDGRLLEGKKVEVVLSAGLPLVRVPDLTGTKLEAAQRSIERGHLSEGKITERYSNEKEGIVLSQSPDDGRVRWSARVDLVVSKGPAPVEVPEVAGASLQDATLRLEAAGFGVEAIEAYSNEVEQGIAMYTDPGAGAIAFSGTVVQVFVSLGPEFEKLKVPDVRNMNVDAARSRLERLGLEVRIVQSCGSGGRTVVDSDPIQGTTVRENDTVALFVC